jgi:ABC-type glycerol-3-phosphate transport system substrate-binding protein
MIKKTIKVLSIMAFATVITACSGVAKKDTEKKVVWDKTFEKK